MIEVTWQLEGSELTEADAETIMRRVIEYHRRALEGVQCSVHGRPPWLIVQGSTGKRLTVSVGSCCPGLKAETEDRLQRVSRREED